MPYALVQLKRDASFEIENSHVRVGRTLLSLDKNPSLIRWVSSLVDCWKLQSVEANTSVCNGNAHKTRNNLWQLW